MSEIDDVVDDLVEACERGKNGLTEVVQWWDDQKKVVGKSVWESVRARLSGAVTIYSWRKSQRRAPKTPTATAWPRSEQRNDRTRRLRERRARAQRRGLSTARSCRFPRERRRDHARAVRER